MCLMRSSHVLFLEKNNTYTSIGGQSGIGEIRIRMTSLHWRFDQKNQIISVIYSNASHINVRPNFRFHLSERISLAKIAQSTQLGLSQHGKVCADHSKARWVSILGSAFFISAWTPRFSVWTPHFGWTPRLNYITTRRAIIVFPKIPSRLLRRLSEVFWLVFFKIAQFRKEKKRSSSSFICPTCAYNSKNE